jgi:hypothetical protein
MKNDANLRAHRFLIIAGTSRGGTTSVFNYLAGHPEICPAEKETRFFLDADYPLPSKRRYQQNNSDTYWSLFQSGPQQNWRFEATPDYLYSANSAGAIHQTLSKVRLIFILREPISRLVSWYRFAHNIGELPSNMTFDGYVAMQRKNRDAFSDLRRHPAFYALQHGRYSLYLRRYFELFGEQSIHVLFYEELRRDPLAFMTSICHSISIDEAHFRDYRFDVINKGCEVRSPYLHRAYWAGKERILKLLQRTPRLRLLRHIHRGMDAAYERLNVMSDKKLSMSRSTRDFISSYYSDEIVRLKRMLGAELPWPSNPSAALAGFEITSAEHRAE